MIYVNIHLYNCTSPCLTSKMTQYTVRFVRNIYYNKLGAVSWVKNFLPIPSHRSTHPTEKQTLAISQEFCEDCELFEVTLARGSESVFQWNVWILLRSTYVIPRPGVPRHICRLQNHGYLQNLQQSYSKASIYNLILFWCTVHPRICSN